MVRLAVSVEGTTEERFVHMALAPHLMALGIFPQPIVLGKRGGDVSLTRIKRDLNLHVRSFDRVTTFYDFYGFRGKDKTEPRESLENKIRHTVPENLRFKLIPYVQMYEYEGILFASPEALEANIGERGLATWAESILKEFKMDPERINDSVATAPSKRLLARTTYLKTTHGPNIAADIGIPALKKACKGFGQWVTALENL